MKILNINKYYQYTSGGDRFFFDTANILKRNGHEIIPFCLSYPGNLKTPYAKYFPEGISGTNVINQTFFKKMKLFLNGIYSIESKKYLSRMLSDVKPDIAHLHILHYTMSPSVIDILHSKNIPIVFSLLDYRVVCSGAYLYTQGHPCQACKGGRYYNAIRYRCDQNSIGKSLLGTIGNYLYRFIHIYEKVDIFTVANESMLELMVNFGIPRKKLRILKNPLYLNEELPQPSVGEYVLYFGNLLSNKGIFTLLKAASNLSDIPFLICGRGNALDQMQKFISLKNIKNVKIDTVTRWHNGLIKVISSSRFVVLPSEWPMPIEYSALESMLLGKAVIASHIGGNQHIIENDITGIFFKAGDSFDLERAIRYLYFKPNICEKMGIKARKRILINFSNESIYNDLVKIYEDAILMQQNRI